MSTSRRRRLSRRPIPTDQLPRAVARAVRDALARAEIGPARADQVALLEWVVVCSNAFGEIVGEDVRPFRDLLYRLRGTLGAERFEALSNRLKYEYGSACVQAFDYEEVLEARDYALTRALGGAA